MSVKTLGLQGESPGSGTHLNGTHHNTPANINLRDVIAQPVGRIHHPPIGRNGDAPGTPAHRHRRHLGTARSIDNTDAVPPAVGHVYRAAVGRDHNADRFTLPSLERYPAHDPPTLNINHRDAAADFTGDEGLLAVRGKGNATGTEINHQIGDNALRPGIDDGHRITGLRGDEDEPPIGGYPDSFRLDSDHQPLGTPKPDLIVPTINVALLVLSVIPMYLADRAARQWQREKVRRWLWVGVGITAAVSLLRGVEFAGLHTRWDSTAYGSIAWILLALHTSLVVTDVFETGVLAVVMGRPPVEQKFFVDVTNNALYSYYLPLSWLPLYAILYLWPALG